MDHGQFLIWFDNDVGIGVNYIVEYGDYTRVFVNTGKDDANLDDLSPTWCFI